MQFTSTSPKILTLLIILICFAVLGCTDDNSSKSRGHSSPDSILETTSVRINVVPDATGSTAAFLATVGDVSSVTIDVSEEGASLVQGQPLVNSGGTWSGVVDGLPVGPTLTFAGHAFDSSFIEIFSGSVNQVLTGSGDTVSIPLAPSIRRK